MIVFSNILLIHARINVVSYLTINRAKFFIHKMFDYFEFSFNTPLHQDKFEVRSKII